MYLSTCWLKFQNEFTYFDLEFGVPSGGLAASKAIDAIQKQMQSEEYKTKLRKGKFNWRLVLPEFRIIFLSWALVSEYYFEEAEEKQNV